MAEFQTLARAFWTEFVFLAKFLVGIAAAGIGVFAIVVVVAVGEASYAAAAAGAVF